MRWWDRLFNGKGIWLLERADATELYGAYLLAGHDLEALFALAILQQEALAHTADEVGLQVEIARCGTRNPYRPGETAPVDAATAQLVFDTVPGAPSGARLPLKVGLLRAQR